MNILNVEVSYYTNHFQKESASRVNLYEYLTKPTPEHIAQVMQVRNCPDPDKQKAMKLKVGCVTASGIFHPIREAENLVKHSGLITLDIDADHNKTINFEVLKREVQRLPFVAACMYSIRGKGIVLYIPIKFPERHRDHFERLSDDFAAHGIKVDPACKDVCRLRYNTFDPEPYINTTAITYNKVKAKVEAVRPANISRSRINTTQAGDLFAWAVSCVERNGVHFAQGHRHHFIFQLSILLNKLGVSKADARAWITANLLPESEIKSNCIDDPYKRYAAEHGTLDYRPGGSTRTHTARPAFAQRFTVYEPFKYVINRTHEHTSSKVESDTNKLSDQEPVVISNSGVTVLSDQEADKSANLRNYHGDLPEAVEVQHFDSANLPDGISQQKATDTHSTKSNSGVTFENQAANWRNDHGSLPPAVHASTAERIAALNDYFSSNTLPAQPIKLTPYISIIDPRAFVAGHLAYVNTCGDRAAFTPYIERLEQFKAALQL